MNSFGWVSDDRKKTGEKLQGKSTKLVSIIKRKMNKREWKKIADYRTRNVFEHNGQVYYFLATTAPSWAPYPFVIDLANKYKRFFHIILLVPDENNAESGSFYSVDGDYILENFQYEKEDGTRNNWTVKKISRDDNGYPYYSLSKSLFKDDYRQSFSEVSKLISLLAE